MIYQFLLSFIVVSWTCYRSYNSIKRDIKAVLFTKGFLSSDKYHMTLNRNIYKLSHIFIIKHIRTSCKKTQCNIQQIHICAHELCSYLMPQFFSSQHIFRLFLRILRNRHACCSCDNLRNSFEQPLPFTLVYRYRISMQVRVVTWRATVHRVDGIQDRLPRSPLTQ